MNMIIIHLDFYPFLFKGLRARELTQKRKGSAQRWQQINLMIEMDAWNQLMQD